MDSYCLPSVTAARPPGRRWIRPRRFLSGGLKAAAWAALLVCVCGLPETGWGYAPDSPEVQQMLDKAIPYFATLFFFVLFCNLLGLLPGMSTATGNLAVTGGLAVYLFGVIGAQGIALQIAQKVNLFDPKNLAIGAVILVFLIWHQTRKVGYLYLGVGLYALSFGNHMTVVTLIPAVVYIILATDYRVLLDAKKVLIMAGLVLLGASQYLYVIIRAHQQPLLNELGPFSWGGWIHWMTRSRFEGQFAAIPGQPFLAVTFQNLDGNGVRGDSALLVDNVMLAAHNSNSSPSAWERVHWNTIRNLLEGLGMDAERLTDFQHIDRL